MDGKAILGREGAHRSKYEHAMSGEGFEQFLSRLSSFMRLSWEAQESLNVLAHQADR